MLQCEQGPCLDCYRDGEPVSVADLHAEEAKWPQFVPTAVDAGFRSVHALPMHLQGVRLGALGLFGTEIGALNGADLELGQALADVASIALIANQTSVNHLRLTQQLQTALDSRVVLEQAKGQLAQVGNVTMAHAFEALRRYARDHNERLSVVAQNVVTRELTGELVLEHAKRKGVSVA
ncbi:GAF and ANTAR domain-containing protein [Sporichthya sp.]|uniref:GAF and ANTAR domain-containing protein n=1 Tax=Sporichthya sp. TaxID=65475 RepID=UPI0017A70BF1|nr:GAF and ANTAR domain-containing protein [Sporichthya sp.]MBA3744655.1 GAF and ANTAR domain-containing protein [Sporichthya sp.]